MLILALQSGGSGLPAATALSLPPGQPLGVTVKADDEAAYISWSAPSSNGGASIDGYKVVANGATATVVAPCGQCTSVYFSGLTNGTSYRFTVYAHNANGWSVVPAVTGGVTPQAPAEPAPGAAQNVTATASGKSATVIWTPPSSPGGAPVDRYLVQAIDETLSASGASFPYLAGSVYACGTCTSATFSGLTSGQKYHFIVWPHNSYSYGLSAASNPVVATDPACAQGQLCLSVDGTSDLGPNSWRADGFLGGIGFQSSNGPDGQTTFTYRGGNAGLVQALSPRSWRTDACTYPGGLNDPAPPICQWAKANSPAALTDALSDTYHSLSYNDFTSLGASGSSAGAVPQWECWNCYSQLVQNIVSHSATNNDAPANLGISVTPDYWDVQNEPPHCCDAGYYGSNQAGTTSLYLQQFRAAYQAIKAAQPNAQVVGPSLSDFVDTPIICDGGDNNCASGKGSNDPHILGLDSFLPYAAQNGLSFSAISWHDNSTFAEDTPNVARDQTAELGSLLIQYGLPPTKAFINEYGSQSTNLIPGWSAGWIASLEQANVDGANRTCWPETDQQKNTYDECGGGSCTQSTPNLNGILGGAFPSSTPGTLDGLFSSPCLSSGALQPNGNYWVYRYYAGMHGERLATDTSDQALTAFATKNDASQTVQMLICRHQTCTRAANPNDCSSSSGEDIAMLPTPAPANVSISVKYPYAVASVKVSVARIPNSSDPVSQPAPATQTLPVVNGVVSVPISGFADGDAYTATITP